MLNNRDDKSDRQEDSEYHFSDDDASYEVEPESESPKPAASSSAMGNVVATLGRSKRMLISAAVFFVLVFIAYKMVVPASTVPSTEITAAPATTTMAQQAPNANAPTSVANTQQNPPVTTAANTAAVAPVTMPANQAPANAGTQQAATMQPSNTPAAPTMVNQSQQTAMPAEPAVGPPQQTVQPVVATGMPAVIPVQSPNAAYSNNVTISGATQAPSNNIEAGMANMNATSERLVNQLQAEYIQKINDYAAQNKALQDQVQQLNSRVANMETQLNQLVQALLRQNEGGAAAPPPASEEAASYQSTNSGKIPYTVQAIIPGRAWLRSDNGETVTVAEGDMIKGLGRVTKIDPYDGVVQVNTGNKVISLSYGNGS